MNVGLSVVKTGQRNFFEHNNARAMVLVGKGLIFFSEEKICIHPKDETVPFGRRQMVSVVRGVTLT